MRFCRGGQSDVSFPSDLVARRCPLPRWSLFCVLLAVGCPVLTVQDKYVAVEYFGSFTQTLRPGLNWAGCDLEWGSPSKGWAEGRPVGDRSRAGAGVSVGVVLCFSFKLGRTRQEAMI